MIRRLSFAILPCLACLIALQSARAQSVNQLPGPSPGKMVIDHARIIPDFAEAQLEALADEIKGFNKSELVILTVQDTGNVDPEKFALDYFNKWGIGEATQNNGLLVFASMNQRTAYIAIGEGLASAENYRRCEDIARDRMVSRFKRNDPAGAMFGGGFAAAREILGYVDLANRLELETNSERRLRKSESPDRKLFFLYLAGAGILLAGVFMFLWSRYQVRYGKRKCKVCENEMVLLDEQQDDRYLDPPEVIEERIGSVDYDVWACMACDHVVKYRYGKWLTRYSRCPQCQYKTHSRISRVLVQATTSRGGRVRVTEDCENCTFHKTYTYATPRLPKPTKIKTSGGWGGGGGFGRSGGGFGGGGGGFGGGRGSSRGGGGARW